MTKMTSARRRNKRWIIVAVVFGVVLVIGITIGVVIWSNNQKNDDVLHGDENNKGEQNDGEKLPDEVRAKIDKMSEREKADEVEYETNLTGSVTHQVIEDGKLTLRVVIDQSINTEGACQLVIDKDGVEKYKNVVLMNANSNYYSCAFDVALSDFANGKYDYEIIMESDSQRGAIDGEFYYD